METKPDRVVVVYHLPQSHMGSEEEIKYVSIAMSYIGNDTDPSIRHSLGLGKEIYETFLGLIKNENFHGAVSMVQSALFQGAVPFERGTYYSFEWRYFKDPDLGGIYIVRMSPVGRSTADWTHAAQDPGAN